MYRVSQRDRRWGNITIGDTNVKLSREGCLITAISMIRSKFYPHYKYGQAFIQPSEFAKGLKYNNRAELIWGSDFEKYGMKFLLRQRSYLPAIHDRELKAYCKNSDYGVCIEVLTRSNSRHWLALVGKSIFGFASNDPWDGERLWRTAGWKAPYYKIIGFAVFKKDEKLEKMTSNL